MYFTVNSIRFFPFAKKSWKLIAKQLIEETENVL